MALSFIGSVTTNIGLQSLTDEILFLSIPENLFPSSHIQMFATEVSWRASIRKHQLFSFLMVRSRLFFFCEKMSRYLCTYLRIVYSMGTETRR